MRNIILSGGWGYGNLGDDAILASSINLIQKKFPAAKIHVLTYCINDSQAVFKTDSNLSFHNSLDLELFGYNYHPAPIGNTKFEDFRFAINKRIHAAFKHNTKHLKTLHEDIDGYIAEHQKQLKEYQCLLESCDLYIMSGGGYILDWANSVASKLIEIYMAKRHNIRSIIMGITYGPFKSKTIRGLAERLVSLADGIFVRDLESLRDLSRIGINCIDEVIPDIALREDFSAPEKKGQIVLIPFNRELEGKAHEICNNIKLICDKYKTSVLIVVSQLWYAPMNIACKFFYLLRIMKCNVEMIIPNDYLDLQKILSESQLVLSQNLHGLILSYRSNTPIISLNAARKFASFMQTIDCSKYIVAPSDISEKNICDIYDEMEKAPQNKTVLFKDKIENSFNRLL